MEYLTQENITAVVAVLSLIAALTPTQKDDTVMARVKNLLGVIGGVFKAKK